MAVQTLILWALVAFAGAVAAWRFYRLLRPLLRARPDPRFDRPGERIIGVLRAVGLHQRLLKIRYSGILHAMIFSSFIVLFTAIVEAFGSGLFPGFSLAPIGGNTWIAWLQEVFAVVILVGLGLAVWQRYVIRPSRFRGSNTLDATLIYLLITAVVLTMLLQAAFAIAAGHDAAAPWRPVSRQIAVLLTALGVSGESAARGEHIFYWAHICAILGFLVYIPGSKHRHMILAAINVYFRSLQPKGTLPPADLDHPPIGVGAIEQFTWKNMLDLYSCTECGRCQAACPAYAAGLPLSPKLLITDLRDHLIDKTNGAAPEPLLGGAIAEETLWACTTCRACMEVCPVHIEHIPKIVDMRRQLVEQARVQPMLQEALSNLQRNGNSMGKSPRLRARWTKELPFKIKDARSEPVNILWFVGDFASFDPRVQANTRRVAELLHAAGVDFGILYEAEQNSGNDVRRAGEEGLFEMLAKHNIELLSGCTFNRVMTTDPHSLNALRQEYRAIGGTFEVIHYTQLLLELIESGRLTLAPGQGEVATYHDPCYLGRYNGGFDAPRRIIERTGHRLHEMKRCRENSFCCGAGGGRIWSDDTGVTERPSENRIKEALALGDAKYFIVACPKDKVMYTAAVQALGVEDRIEVRDIVDLIKLAPHAIGERQPNVAA
ncbi:MAG: (Fe-S)-binding protein [Xanthobacteraceae bacterium]